MRPARMCKSQLDGSKALIVPVLLVLVGLELLEKIKDVNIHYYGPSNLAAINALMINWKSSPSPVLTSQMTHERVLDIKEILFHPYPLDRKTDEI
ncbi:hypothetical protein WISP_101245 [Willisornis vidua]|uniref:Uncharacterized protein n=1 Tax=Willisornis vidua TaxID=1566151 RepID=A0ABQ9D1A3_9PASS|nr:hypothetical protein WISP_101245 [Willisornis vidua]